MSPAPRSSFRAGWSAMLPLWLGVVPFAIAYALTAREAGLSLVETQALSLLVFAGSAQFSAAALFGRGAGGPEIVLTTLLLNVRHVLYGLSLGRQLPLRGVRRLTGAFLLTDEAYGVVTAERARTFSYLLGAELSLFVTWNLATLAGALLGASIPDPAAVGVDLVFPLAFLALLVPMLTGRVELAVAAGSGLLAWVLSRHISGGLTILAAGILGGLAGAWLTRDRFVSQPPGTDAVEAGGP
ncbi:MAG: AzlC family ABC transporter permease [Gaiella sp.]